MELNQYLKILQKYWLFLSIFALIGSTVAYVFTSKLPSGYRQSQLFIINVPEKQFEGFNFEGFYGQERARNFTDTAVAVLKSPEFQQESSPDSSTDAQKVTPQLIRITVTSATSELSQAALSKIPEKLNQKLIDITDTTQPIQIKPIAPSTTASHIVPNQKIYIPFGFAIGLTFALFIIGLKTYFKL